jgi:hypothetical protein
MLWYRITRQAGVMNQVLHVLGENTSEIKLRKESSGPYYQRNRYFVMYYKYSSLLVMVL